MFYAIRPLLYFSKPRGCYMYVYLLEYIFKALGSLHRYMFCNVMCGELASTQVLTPQFLRLGIRCPVPVYVCCMLYGLLG